MSDYEGDYTCSVSEDSRCGREATRVVHEPYTPGNFKVLCCDECARDLLSLGYHADPEAEKKLAEDKHREAEYFERDELDSQMTEAERLGESRVMR